MQANFGGGGSSAGENAPSLDALIEQADVLVQEASALSARYRDLQESIEALAAGEPLPLRGSPSVAGEDTHADPTESIRTVATNLALSGSTRQESAMYLEETFGAGDYEPILAELFPDGRGGERRRRRRFRRR